MVRKRNPMFSVQNGRKNNVKRMPVFRNQFWEFTNVNYEYPT